MDCPSSVRFIAGAARHMYSSQVDTFSAERERTERRDAGRRGRPHTWGAPSQPSSGGRWGGAAGEVAPKGRLNFLSALL
jgi:hypothetical protein